MQPEDNGSMPVAAAEGSSNPPRRPLVLRDVMFQACIQNKSLLTTRGEIQDVLDREGYSNADLVDLLRSEIGQLIKTDGTIVSVRSLIVLDRNGMAAMESEEQKQRKGQQKEVLVQHLPLLGLWGWWDYHSHHSLTSPSVGDNGDAAAPTVGEKMRQWLSSLASDTYDSFALGMKRHVPPAQVDAVDLVIGTFDVVCDPFMVAECLQAILEHAPTTRWDGEAARLLHRHGKGRDTFEGFCCEEVPAMARVGRDASQLLRVVSSSSLDLLLEVMVRADLAALLCDGKVVVLGYRARPHDNETYVTTIRLGASKLETERKLDELKEKEDDLRAQASEVEKEDKESQSQSDILRQLTECEDDITEMFTQLETIVESLLAHESRLLQNKADRVFQYLERVTNARIGGGRERLSNDSDSEEE